MADVQITAGATSAAPLDYVIPGAQEIIVKALTATYDGNLAAGSFVPAVQVIAPGGKLVGTYLAVGQVSDFSAVDVSFGPFLVGLGDAIRFDVDNVGGTLDIETTGQAPVTGDGIRVNAGNGGALDLIGDGSVTIQANNGAFTLQNLGTSGLMQMISDNGTLIEESSTQAIVINATGGGEIHVTTTGAGTQVYSSADGFIYDSTHTATGLVAFAFRVRTGDIFAVEDGSSSNFQLMQVGPGVAVFNLQANKSFTLKDHSGNTILRVDENGPAYHIKTGKVWVADL